MKTRMNSKLMQKSVKLGLDYEELDHKILYFPGACPDPEASIAFVESMPDEWYENASEANEDGAARHDCYVAFPSQAEADVVSDVFVTFADKYGEVLKDEQSSNYMQSDVEYNAVRYRVGGEAKNHVDQPTAEDIGLVNICIYLNDDYEGGELGFIVDKDRQHDNAEPDLERDLIYKPKRGDMLIFPGHFWHYALPTTSGTKYLVLLKAFVEREENFEYTGVEMTDYLDDNDRDSK